MASLPKDDAGWMTELSPNQFAVLRQKATEPPGYSEGTEGELEHDLKRDYGTKYPDGVYECAGCREPLYFARTKFNSGAAGRHSTMGSRRNTRSAGRRTDAIEIVCAKCDGHLGHVFKNEGFPTPTDERHCVNGISLRYEPAGYQPDDTPKLLAALVPKPIPP